MCSNVRNMQCAVCSVSLPCAVCSVQCAVCSVQCAVSSVQCCAEKPVQEAGGANVRVCKGENWSVLEY